MSDGGKVESLSLDDESGGIIRLVSKDGREFPIEKKHAFVSNLVKTSMDSDSSASDLPMPGVRGDILAKVVEYLAYHKGVESPAPEKPLRSAVMKDVCKDPWDADYIDRIGSNRQQLYELILAANYMDIKALLHLGCAKVASLIKGQPLEKAKDILMKGDAPGAGAGHSSGISSGSSSVTLTTAAPGAVTATPDKKEDKKLLQ